MKVFFSLVLLTVFVYPSRCQVIIDSVLIEGNFRTFRFFQPRGDTKMFNLLFILHGSGGNGEGMMQPAANLQNRAGKEPVFIVYPDGYKRYWNECRKEATSEANKVDINEQAFFAAMLHYFGKKYGVNDTRFFVIGLSGGGHMAYKLAMTMPDQCRAISAIVANVPDTMNLDCVEVKKPVAVMITNGTNDEVNPYNGGRMAVNGASWGQVRSTNSSFRYWADIAGYKDQPVQDELPDSDPANKQTITRFTFKQDGRPAITLLQVNGGEHAFPRDIDIFLDSWTFFQQEIKREESGHQ